MSKARPALNRSRRERVACRPRRANSRPHLVVRPCLELPRGSGSSRVEEEAAALMGIQLPLVTCQVALSHDILFLPVSAGEHPRPHLFLSQRNS